MKQTLLMKAMPYAGAQFFMVALHWMTMLFMPVYFEERGVSGGGVGALVSFFSLSTLFLVFPMGALADRLPARSTLLAGSLVVCVSYSLMPLATGYIGWGLAMAGVGAGYTLSSISLFSLFFKQVGTSRRGLEVSIFNIGGIMGAGLGAWVAGALVNIMSASEVIFYLGLSCAVVWALISLSLPKIRGISFPILEYGQDLRRADTWLLIAIIFIAASHAGFEQAGYALLQINILGLSPRQVGELFLILAFWMSAVTLLTGRLHDHRQRPLLMMGAGLVMSGVFMAASGSAVGAADFLLYRVLHTAGDAVLSLLIFVIAAMIFPRHRAGGAFAFVLTVNTAAYFLFANLAGAVAESFGLDSSFHLSGAIMVVGGAALLIYRPRLRKIFRIEERQDERIEVNRPPGSV